MSAEKEEKIHMPPELFLLRGIWCLLGASGFPDSSVGKESTWNEGDPGLIPGSGISTGERKGYPLHYSGLENSMDYSPRGCKESDMTEQLSLSLSNVVYSMGRIHHFSKLRIKLYYLKAKTGSNITS